MLHSAPLQYSTRLFYVTIEKRGFRKSNVISSLGVDDAGVHKNETKVNHYLSSKGQQTKEHT